MLTIMLRPARQAGGVTLLFAATMLLLVSAAAAAMLQMLLGGRHLAMAARDRETAFRAAEAALADAEADLLAAAQSDGGRLGHWPPPGECGSGAQAGLCNTGSATLPIWQPWLQAAVPDTTIGVPLGHFTGATMPDLPPVLGEACLPPRYVAELFDEVPAGADAAAGRPRLRITAIGFGRSPAFRAVLQSIVQP